MSESAKSTPQPVQVDTVDESEVNEYSPQALAEGLQPSYIFLIGSLIKDFIQAPIHLHFNRLILPVL